MVCWNGKTHKSTSSFFFLVNKNLLCYSGWYWGIHLYLKILGNFMSRFRGHILVCEYTICQCGQIHISYSVLRESSSSLSHTSSNISFKLFCLLYHQLFHLCYQKAYTFWSSAYHFLPGEFFAFFFVKVWVTANLKDPGFF